MWAESATRIDAAVRGKQIPRFCPASSPLAQTPILCTTALIPRDFCLSSSRIYGKRQSWMLLSVYDDCQEMYTLTFKK
jgi:hypothetical protein